MAIICLKTTAVLAGTWLARATLLSETETGSIGTDLSLANKKILEGSGGTPAMNRLAKEETDLTLRTIKELSMKTNRKTHPLSEKSRSELSACTWIGIETKTSLSTTICMTNAFCSAGSSM
jgi:hypothetical protein